LVGWLELEPIEHLAAALVRGGGTARVRVDSRDAVGAGVAHVDEGERRDDDLVTGQAGPLEPRRGGVGRSAGRDGAPGTRQPLERHAFREDEARHRARNTAQNMTTLRHFALNIIKGDKARKLGVANTRKRAGWDRGYLLDLLKGAAV